MKCPNCSTDNAAGDQYCVACGNQLTGAVPQAATPVIIATTHQPDPNAATVTPVNAGPAIATLTYAGKNIPLYEGSKVIIAREDSDKCKPDLPISGGSGTPVEVTVENGQVMICDTGTSIGTRVVVYLPPGGKMPGKPGDMLMLGDQVISIG